MDNWRIEAEKKEVFWLLNGIYYMQLSTELEQFNQNV